MGTIVSLGGSKTHGQVSITHASRRQNRVPVLNAFDLLATWSRRVTERRELAKLAGDPRLLQDIGVTLTDALHEVEKPFWRS